MFRTLRRKIFRLALVSGAGAAANYFFDSERGEQRREEAKAKADTMLKRSTPSATWQPERSANSFDTPTAAPTPPAGATPVTAMTDVITTPEREIDPIGTPTGPVTTPFPG